MTIVPSLRGNLLYVDCQRVRACVCERVSECAFASICERLTILVFISLACKAHLARIQFCLRGQAKEACKRCLSTNVPETHLPTLLTFWFSVKVPTGKPFMSSSWQGRTMQGVDCSTSSAMPSRDLSQVKKLS